MTNELTGHVALVAGATRGAGRGIAVQLGAAGATVYVTGRSSRLSGASPMSRPETIEDTADLVTAAGGRAIPVRVDHSRPDEVRSLIARIAQDEQGRLDLLVNDIWGGDPLTEWDVPFWEHSLLTPGFLRSEAVLDHFGVTEPTWRDAIATDPHLVASETPTYIGRAVVALAADPDVGIRSGQALSTGKLAREYGFTDVDGTQPDWGSYFATLGSGQVSS